MQPRMIKVEQGICKVCQKKEDSGHNFKLACSTCHGFWHQQCHAPVIDSVQVSKMIRASTLTTWKCANCSRPNLKPVLSAPMKIVDLTLSDDGIEEGEDSFHSGSPLKPQPRATTKDARLQPPLPPHPLQAKFHIPLIRRPSRPIYHLQTNAPAQPAPSLAELILQALSNEIDTKGPLQEDAHPNLSIPADREPRKPRKGKPQLRENLDNDFCVTADEELMIASRTRLK